MRSCVVAFLLFCAAAAAAESKKEAWLWTAEERIRERFRPESKAARMQLAQSSTRKSPPNAWPISGDTHPELFFPWELMDRLLRLQTVSPAHLNAVREAYRPHIVSAGWDFDTFWRELDAGAADYLFIFHHLQEEQRKTRGRGPEGADRDRIAEEFCEARAAAMSRMRSRFGQVAFDRFLYTAMTPGLQSWTTDQRDAASLVRTEGGCK